MGSCKLAPQVFARRQPVCGPQEANSIVDKKIARRGDSAGTSAAPLPEACRKFLKGYSEFRDGRLDSESRSFFVGHIARCSSCRRYDRVICKGVQVLREPGEVPAAAPMNIAEVRYRATAFERESLALGTAGSGVTLSAAVVVALLLAVVAWSPFFSGTTPEVEMPPVLAVTPPSTSAPTFAPLERRSAAELRQPDLWDGIRSILSERESRRQATRADPNPD